MKLSKQERIAAIVVIIIVIIAVGVFVFIKPKIETINATKSELESKKTEYENDVARAGTKDQLKADILKAYNDGKDLADMFFPELSSYETDYAFRAFLDQCANKNNILVEDLKVTDPGTAGLSTSVYTPSGTKYALKDYVNQGNDAAPTDPNLLRQRMIQTALGEAQTIGASTVTFDVKALSIDDILKFADEVNSYELMENGKNVRKAIELNGVAFTNKKIEAAYELIGEESLKEAKEAGEQAFKDFIANLQSVSHSGLAEAPADAAATDGNNGGGTDNTPELDVVVNDDNFEFHFYTLSCTITFYSIERMQDPTAKLAEQDKAAGPAA